MIQWVIQVYCSPNHATSHQYDCIACQIMLAISGWGMIQWAIQPYRWLMAWLGEWYKHIGDSQHDLFTDSGISVNDTVIRCIDRWYACIADWITVLFIDMPESVSKSCCQLPIGLYCSPSCCIIQRYASVGKQIMLSVNDMLVLLTQSFYQSPVALNC